MMPCEALSGDEMRRIDHYTIDKLGVPARVLMEKAGKQTVYALLGEYPELRQGRGAIICGTGNNGGDGAYTALHLTLSGIKIEVFLVGDLSKQSEAAKEAFRRLQEFGVPVTSILSPVPFDLSRFEFVVDGIFGIGFHGKISGIAEHVVHSINSAAGRGVKVVSIDIPSGLSADDFSQPEVFVRADLTVTFGFAKHSQVVHPTKGLMGRLRVVDIGFPSKALAAVEKPAVVLKPETLDFSLLRRNPASHKGNYGHTLIIGGSQGMYGAPILAAHGALHAGAGLVSVMIAHRPGDPLPAFAPELMVETISDGGGSFRNVHSRDVLNYITSRRVDSLVIGMGGGCDPSFLEFVAAILDQTDIPVILDADALPILSSGLKVRKPERIIATPHAGEFQRLVGNTDAIEKVQRPMINLLNHAKKLGVTLVHKSATTIIATPEGNAYINTSGTPAMACGGMGDTLAGIIGGFRGMGMSREDAAGIGVYLHGLAGELAAEQNGAFNVTGSEVVSKLGNALRLALKVKEMQGSD
jgi:NAD(P)H-hydrate epimerase